MNALPWIDASKAHLLAACALRWVTETRTGPNSRRSATGGGWSAATLGIQAHKALEQWVLESDWRKANPGELLQQRFHALTESNSQGVGAARIIASKLAVRGRELAHSLNAARCQEVVPELFVSDDHRRLRGGMDLVAIGDDVIHIFDLKTGQGYIRTRPMPPAAHLQLAVYSVLATGKWQRPATVSILSLDTGLIDDSELTAQAAEDIVKTLEEKRKAAVAAAIPPAVASPETCRWCPLRRACPAHWAAVEARSITDALTGTLERCTVSANGHVSVVLQTPEGRQLVTGLSAVPNVVAGDWVAALRVKQLEDEPNVWHANVTSAVEPMNL
ncbi:PD-(D/E)XK nuclease family protein [Mycobacterium sp.]|uniref:PD-(D/E)XK nuclease family protein n=1 Tax=Mycobacterium sp. TaxID=1785 RepID=UPI003D09A2EF